METGDAIAELRARLIRQVAPCYFAAFFTTSRSFSTERTSRTPQRSLPALTFCAGVSTWPLRRMSPLNPSITIGIRENSGSLANKAVAC